MTDSIKILLLIILSGSIFGINYADAHESTKCINIFQQTTLLTEQAGNEDEESSQIGYLHKITSSIITATESYLNNCIDSKQPLNKQLVALHKLGNEGKQNCLENNTVTQLIDINNDGHSELLLHTKLLACEDFSGHSNGGFTALFILNFKTGIWKGYSIWPIQLLEKDVSKLTVYDFMVPQYHPKIYMIDFKDTKGRRFMAIESEFLGGDNAANQLSIVRWEGPNYKIILNLHLSDWCGQTNYWTISKKGTVIVPGDKATLTFPRL